MKDISLESNYICEYNNKIKKYLNESLLSSATAWRFNI